nr:GNAT family N-acetyltransferase [Streptomyces sp. SID13031]
MRGMHRNHQAFWSQMARTAGGEVDQLAGGLLVTTGIPAAPFNQLHCDPGMEGSSTIAEAAAHFEKLGLPWRIVCEAQSPEAEEFSRERHGESQPLYPILSRDVEQGRAPTPVAGLQFVTAGDLGDLQAFVNCAGACYQHDPALIQKLVSSEALVDEDFQFHLGMVAGDCVAISVGVSNGQTAGAYFVGVRPEHRGKGYGRALTEQALLGATSAQTRTAVLQATPDGLPVYLRMGFRHVGDYHNSDLPVSAAGVLDGS